MGTIFASTIIARLRKILQDEDSDQYIWPDSILLGYLNDAQRAIVLLKPNASITNASVKLTAGAKQAIPETGIALIKITRNMGLVGTSPGKIIHSIDMEQYGYLESEWSGGDAAPYVDHYMFDPDDPTHFYVSPPQPATPCYVEEIYSSPPTDIATTETAISLNDIYAGPLMNYALYRSYATEIDQTSSALSEKYYNLFLSELGLKAQAEQSNPTRKR
jgi:hypothetical protein